MFVGHDEIEKRRRCIGRVPSHREVARVLVFVDVNPVGAVVDVPRVRSLARVILRIRFPEQRSHVPRRHGETSRLLLRVHFVDIALGRCLSAPHC